MSSKPVGVLFVCLGNICRSPAAEGIFRKLAQEAQVQDQLLIDSAGTSNYHIDEPPDPRMLAAATHRGIALEHLRTRQVTAADFHRFDYVLCMDQRNLQALRQVMPPDATAHVGLLMRYAPTAGFDEVPDPYFGDEAGFEFTLDLLTQACQGLLDHMISQGKIIKG